MRIHFIGIGGIGVSALAQYYLAKGYLISGSDLQESEITKFLRKKGAKIFIGHRAENLPDNTNLVIYTSAVPRGNPEFVKSQKHASYRPALYAKFIKSEKQTIGLEGGTGTGSKVKSQSYAQALGELTQKYFTIAVSGTHGKSTTTAMISLILVRAGLNPTVIIGTKLKEFRDSNFRMGSESPVACCQSPVLVIEADEYKAAFLNYSPKIIVLTNIEREHLDYFKNLRFILKTYREYISHLPKTGFLVLNRNDKNIAKLKNHILKLKIKTREYSLGQKESKKLKNILKIPGVHNVQNALAALTCARILKIPDKISFEALKNYQGAWRRFEIFHASLNGTPYTLISDYGHHPTEIKATLNAAREKFGKKRIICVFQPHQRQRTKLLFEDFVRSFNEADYLVLNEIYGVVGREKSEDISSRDLLEAIRRRWGKKKKGRAVFFENIEDISKYLKTMIKPNDVVMVMGAGSIYELVLKLKSAKN